MLLHACINEALKVLTYTYVVVKMPSITFRDYGQLAKEDIILRTDNQRDENRLTGASIFPTDLGLAINSQHHPWACSLRTRGYRGRHRCGVTLLWGNYRV